ncbi:MAG TPA: L-erythro-3,5-diaminohexanoate dehydrogenase [Myxococcota bacterium]|mgnify:FL=1|nr:L-erythro-3,5-diaminohexanoate dehydrogenase [Myxococcota bacterium]HQK51002.1 L-erythro-3,5-diaminohexanoate dehydrogenase [Myxococcota bacterium]
MDIEALLGAHRVLEPPGVLPQAAWRLDATLPIHPTEILLDVEVLNIDAASFHQMKEAVRGDPEGIARQVLETVRVRGKQHNPVTGSGGMLIGRVREVGRDYQGRLEARPGDAVATLVSLSLTPLHLQAIRAVHLDRDQVEVEGHAILFSSGIAARLPEDLPERLALAVLDVAGAPAQTRRLVRPGMHVGILGSGKSGLLAAAVARQAVGPEGRVYALDLDSRGPDLLVGLGYAHVGLVADARNPVEVLRKVEQATGGRMFDVTLNTTNVPGTEMATVIATRDGGTAYFFNMATSAAAATLGAEGVGKDVVLEMGNGYVPGHAEFALDLVRREDRLREVLERRYAR